MKPAYHDRTAPHAGTFALVTGFEARTLERSVPGFTWKAGHAERKPAIAKISALDEDRPRPLGTLAFGHDAKALGHFGIGFEQAAEVPAEAILVELLVRLDVP